MRTALELLESDGTRNRISSSALITRRSVLAFALCVLLFALSATAPAQQAQKVYGVGYLSPRLGIEPRENEFRRALRELGYSEGRNIIIEWRFAKGKTDLFPELAANLVGLKLDCIVAIGVNAIGALKQLTHTIPIVMGTIDADPVREGFVKSLARPGGNVTGLTGISHDIAGKRLELLKEVIPKAARIGILVDPSLASEAHVKEAEQAARALGIKLQLLEAREAERLEEAFRAARQKRAEALSVVGTGLLNSHRSRITNLATKMRLPSIYSNVDFVADGGLMSYAADPLAQFRRIAWYVDKILKGANPTDLPVEQPRKFEFVINLKAAKQIGLTIPPNVLARADRVIR